MCEILISKQLKSFLRNEWNIFLIKRKQFFEMSKFSILKWVKSVLSEILILNWVKPGFWKGVKPVFWNEWK